MKKNKKYEPGKKVYKNQIKYFDKGFLEEV